jgi:hypothetical protein
MQVMDANIINSARDFIHIGSIAGIILMVTVIAIGTIRPHAFRKLLREFSERRYIVVFGVFAALLCGTTILATEDPQNMMQPGKTASSSVQDNTQELKPKGYVKDIRTQDLEVTDKIAFDTQKQNDAGLAQGQTKTLQAGKDGQKTKVYSVTMTDGKETSRELVSEIIVSAPVTEIIAVGTQALSAPVAANPQSSPSNTQSAAKPSSDSSNKEAPKQPDCLKILGVKLPFCS